MKKQFLKSIITKIFLIILLFTELFTNTPTNNETTKYITTKELIQVYKLDDLISSFNKLQAENSLKENSIEENNFDNKTKKAIVVGATSGIGKHIAIALSKEGYDVGLVGQNINILNSLKKQISTKSYIKQIDITKSESAREKLKELILQMNGLDLMFISISGWNNQFEEKWKYNQNIIEVDALGFFTAADVAINFFEKQKHGHLVGISSIDGIRGNATCPVYSGAKAFVSTYLEGIRNYMLQNKISINITNIVPGWIDTEKVQYSKMPNSYWVTSINQATKEIMNAIKKKKKQAYITKRWQLIAILMNIIPDYLYNKMKGL